MLNAIAVLLILLPAALASACLAVLTPGCIGCHFSRTVALALVRACMDTALHEPVSLYQLRVRQGWACNVDLWTLTRTAPSMTQGCLLSVPSVFYNM